MHSLRNFRRDPYHGCDELFVHVDVALVLGKVSFAVSLIQYPPLLRGQVDRVLQALEDQISCGRPIPSKSQCRQSEGMGRVVGEIEATLEAECFVPCILETTIS